jgi:hypothetical protein
MLPQSTTLPIKAQKILIDAAAGKSTMDQFNYTTYRTLKTNVDIAIQKVRKEYPEYFKVDPLYD